MKTDSKTRFDLVRARAQTRWQVTTYTTKLASEVGIKLAPFHDGYEAQGGTYYGIHNPLARGPWREDTVIILADGAPVGWVSDYSQGHGAHAFDDDLCATVSYAPTREDALKSFITRFERAQARRAR